MASEEPFELTVGLAPERSAGVVGDQLVRPPSSVGPYELTVQVVADGFDLASGESWRNQAMVTADRPYPTFTLHLTAEPQAVPALPRTVQATFSTGGQTMGFAVRAIAVVRDQALLGAAPLPEQEPDRDLSLVTEWEAPDLTMRIHRGKQEHAGRLLWTFESPHPIELPDGELVCDIGAEPERFARDLVEQVARRERQQDLYLYLRGIGRQIADRMPAQAWSILRAVADATSGTPSVLLLSEEPYVPWELATVEPPLDPAAPPFLSAQAVVGRWVLRSNGRPPPQPPALAEVRSVAVVSGVYDSPSWRRLTGAEDEAAALRAAYAAHDVSAAQQPVLACLEGDPSAELLHFSMHGKWDVTGVENGLVLVDDKVLAPTVVKGVDLEHRPFVFMNACQVGAGEEMLGDYAGMAEAFLYAGACAVVAPLWAIDDLVARDIAVRFYERTFADVSPAEALREERLAFQASAEGASSTCLAYQFFGHPTMRVHRNPS